MKLYLLLGAGPTWSGPPPYLIPITANQKIQPNYVKSNVQNREPDKVGNLKVSAVGYYNRVQQQTSEISGETKV